MHLKFINYSKNTFNTGLYNFEIFLQNSVTVPPPPTTKFLLQQYFTPTKIKISDPLSKHFSKNFSPYPQAGGDAYHATHCIFDRSYKIFHTELKFKLYSCLVLTLRKLCFISKIKTFFQI